jgi:hypothetical protein
MSFNVGNAVKYLWRADEKGAALEDLKKAAWYVQREIERRACEAFNKGAAVDRPVRRVVCAAIRAADRSLLLGVRHYSMDMHEQIAARRDGDKFKHRHDEDQGFVDQHGLFMDRNLAYRVALDAGQLVYPERCGSLDAPKLYSEGLY